MKLDQKFGLRTKEKLPPSLEKIMKTKKSGSRYYRRKINGIRRII